MNTTLYKIPDFRTILLLINYRQILKVKGSGNSWKVKFLAVMERKLNVDLKQHKQLVHNSFKGYILVDID